MLYQISFFFGYIVSASLYYIFNLLSPPPGLGEQVDFNVSGMQVIDGASISPETETVSVQKTS